MIQWGTCATSEALFFVPALVVCAVVFAVNTTVFDDDVDGNINSDDWVSDDLDEKVDSKMIMMVKVMKMNLMTMAMVGLIRLKINHIIQFIRNIKMMMKGTMIWMMMMTVQLLMILTNQLIWKMKMIA